MENKVLILDIEISPILAYVWGLKDQNVSLSQIKEDWHLMAWSAKWLDEPASSIVYMDKRNDDTDERILKGIWKMLDQAEIVVTQNGKKFDSRKLNARFMQYGMPPPTPYKHHDTYLIVREAAEFTSHKLEYLTDKLNTKYKKLDHGKFPGWSLWIECLKGNKKAWDEMKDYNIHDVLSTEELYKIVRPWAPKSAAPVYVFTGKCKMCGSKNLQKRGFDATALSVYQRLQCQDCKRWQRGDKIKEAKSER